MSNRIGEESSAWVNFRRSLKLDLCVTNVCASDGMSDPKWREIIIICVTSNNLVSEVNRAALPTSISIF